MSFLGAPLPLPHAKKEGGGRDGQGRSTLEALPVMAREAMAAAVGGARWPGSCAATTCLVWSTRTLGQVLIPIANRQIATLCG